MGLFSSSKNKNTLPECSLVPEPISMDVVKELFPIKDYDNEMLLAFTADLKSEVFPKQTTLFSSGEKTDSALYLLKGTVSLLDQTGKTFEIASETGKSKFPLSSGSTHVTTAIAKTDVSVLRVSHKILSPKHTPASGRSELVVPSELSKNRLISSFIDHYNHEELKIPSLPDVAIKLRNAMQSDAGIADIVKIIQLDPVISAKLIGLANCPLYISVNPVKSCFEAVNRIGLNATSNLVISLGLSSNFKSNSPLIKKYFDKIWEQSVYISTLSYFLATATKQINPQEAQLAGLICDIGAVPFLSFAANHSSYFESDIKLALPYVKGPVGHRILLDWGFTEEFLNVPLCSEDWFQNSSNELNLTDIVVLSQLHYKTGQPNMTEIPPITSIPAASKLKNLSLSPEFSLNILSEAKQQINETIKMFSS
jgi:HD-like signal output (HDOD) protein